MEEFKSYKRIQVAELRPVTNNDIDSYSNHGGKLFAMNGEQVIIVSISEQDLISGSPKKGDMIARNPKNHNDQWLVAKEYFEENFDPNPS